MGRNRAILNKKPGSDEAGKGVHFVTPLGAPHEIARDDQEEARSSFRMRTPYARPGPDVATPGGDPEG